MRTKIIAAMLAVASLTSATHTTSAAQPQPQTFKFNNLTWTVPKPPNGLTAATTSWHGAEKYCKDMGARLPTKDELLALNRAGATPEGWYSNVTTTSTPFGPNKHYTVFMGLLDGLGWVADNDMYGAGVVTCVK